MKSLASKILSILLLFTLLLGCEKDDNCSTLEGTLKILVDIPEGYRGNSEIDISPVENPDIDIYKVKVENKTEIEVELNIGNYKVSFAAHNPKENNSYYDTQYVQIRQGKTTEIVIKKP
ncbi:MAG: hypothetical protein ACOYEA_06860 [Fermentimonas sp.]|jgi:hypothetical protein